MKVILVNRHMGFIRAVTKYTQNFKEKKGQLSNTSKQENMSGKKKNQYRVITKGRIASL